MLNCYYCNSKYVTLHQNHLKVKAEYILFFVLRVILGPLTISTVESSESEHAPLKIEAEFSLRLNTAGYLDFHLKRKGNLANLRNTGAVFQLEAIPTFWNNKFSSENVQLHFCVECCLN